jgi:heme/copper-type cytochrome/quinol oxidase subunit 4
LFIWENIDYTRAGLGIMTGMIFSLPLVWIVHDYLVKKSWLISFILTFLPAIAKYIPGKIWSVLGFILQAKNMANISEKDASFFQLYSQIIGLLSSVLLTIIGITTIKNSQLLFHFNVGAIILLLASVFAIYMLIKISKNYNHIINKSRIIPHITALSIQKISKGLSLILFLSAFIPVHEFIFEILLAFIIAMQMGVLAFFAPAGLGVTEGAYAMLLSDQFTLAVAIQIAILARIWQTILDFLLAIIGFILKLIFFE